ncbi:hypothetical protein [Collimonas fungivorans]|uniref:hypothetical protein n=1 Tax=Collimonas fungivorans TaxID=158899 RepID=UPI0011D286DE|nr:hypothetical protein [Collimonas fungivorans]
MHRLFQKQLILKTSLGLALTITAMSGAMAMSGPFEHPAQVILKDGSPCFFSDFGERPWSGYNLTVEINKGSSAGMVWVISTAENVEKPSTVQNCVRYGQAAGPAKTIKPAAPLREGLPYLGIIDTGDRARYGIPFCIGRDSQTNPILTKWNENGDGCTEVPLNQTDKPSLFKRWFSK